MGLREKFTLVLVILVFVQIACRHCMPRTPRKASLKRYLNSLKPVKNNPTPTPYSPSRIAKSPKQNFKKTGQNVKIKQNLLPKKSLYETYNFPETDFPLDTSPRDPFHFGMNMNAKNQFETPKAQSVPTAINNIKKQMKMKRKLSSNKQINNEIAKPQSEMSSIKCVLGSDTRLLDSGTFPEVQYPLNTMETWMPNYWSYLPFTQDDQYNRFDRQTFFPKAKENNIKSLPKLTKATAKQFLQPLSKLKEEQRRISTENSKRSNSGTKGLNFTKTATCESVAEDLITAGLITSALDNLLSTKEILNSTDITSTLENTCPVTDNLYQSLPIPYKVIEKSTEDVCPVFELKNNTMDVQNVNKSTISEDAEDITTNDTCQGLTEIVGNLGKIANDLCQTHKDDCMKMPDIITTKALGNEYLSKTLNDTVETVISSSEELSISVSDHVPTDLLLNNMTSLEEEEKIPDDIRTIVSPLNVSIPLLFNPEPESNSTLSDISGTHITKSLSNVSAVPGTTSIIIIPINTNAVGKSTSHVLQSVPDTPIILYIPPAQSNNSPSQTLPFNQNGFSLIEKPMPNSQFNILSNTAPLLNDNRLVSGLQDSLSNNGSPLPIYEMLPTNSMCYNNENSPSSMKEKPFLYDPFRLTDTVPFVSTYCDEELPQTIIIDSQQNCKLVPFNFGKDVLSYEPYSEIDQLSKARETKSDSQVINIPCFKDFYTSNITSLLSHISASPKPKKLNNMTDISEPAHSSLPEQIDRTVIPIQETEKHHTDTSPRQINKTHHPYSLVETTDSPLLQDATPPPKFAVSIDSELDLNMVAPLSNTVLTQSDTLVYDSPIKMDLLYPDAFIAIDKLPAADLQFSRYYKKSNNFSDQINGLISTLPNTTLGEKVCINETNIALIPKLATESEKLSNEPLSDINLTNTWAQSILPDHYMHDDSPPSKDSSPINIERPDSLDIITPSVNFLSDKIDNEKVDQNSPIDRVNKQFPIRYKMNQVDHERKETVAVERLSTTSSNNLQEHLDNAQLRLTNNHTRVVLDKEVPEPSKYNTTMDPTTMLDREIVELLFPVLFLSDRDILDSSHLHVISNSIETPMTKTSIKSSTAGMTNEELPVPLNKDQFLHQEQTDPTNKDKHKHLDSPNTFLNSEDFTGRIIPNSKDNILHEIPFFNMTKGSLTSLLDETPFGSPVSKDTLDNHPLSRNKKPSLNTLRITKELLENVLSEIDKRFLNLAIPKALPITPLSVNDALHSIDSMNQECATETIEGNTGSVKEHSVVSFEDIIMNLPFTETEDRTLDIPILETSVESLLPIDQITKALLTTHLENPNKKENPYFIDISTKDETSQIDKLTSQQKHASSDLLSQLNKKPLASKLPINKALLKIILSDLTNTEFVLPIAKALESMPSSQRNKPVYHIKSSSYKAPKKISSLPEETIPHRTPSKLPPDNSSHSGINDFAFSLTEHDTVYNKPVPDISEEDSLLQMLKDESQMLIEEISNKDQKDAFRQNLLDDKPENLIPQNKIPSSYKLHVIKALLENVFSDIIKTVFSLPVNKLLPDKSSSLLNKTEYHLESTPTKTSKEIAPLLEKKIPHKNLSDQPLVDSPFSNINDVVSAIPKTKTVVNNPKAPGDVTIATDKHAFDESLPDNKSERYKTLSNYRLHITKALLENILSEVIKKDFSLPVSKSLPVKSLSPLNTSIYYVEPSISESPKEVIPEPKPYPISDISVKEILLQMLKDESQILDKGKINGVDNEAFKHILPDVKPDKPPLLKNKTPSSSKLQITKALLENVLSDVKKGDFLQPIAKYSPVKSSLLDKTLYYVESPENHIAKENINPLATISDTTTVNLSKKVQNIEFQDKTIASTQNVDITTEELQSPMDQIHEVARDLPKHALDTDKKQYPEVSLENLRSIPISQDVAIQPAIPISQDKPDDLAFPDTKSVLASRLPRTKALLENVLSEITNAGFSMPLSEIDSAEVKQFLETKYLSTDKKKTEYLLKDDFLLSYDPVPNSEFRDVSIEGSGLEVD